MRWDNLTIDAEDRTRLPGYKDAAVVRHFDAPEALDTRFYEVRAKSALNRVPERSRMPFRWTINPYRGCSHACVYCFARPTHKYLDMDAGRDFEREIVVKVNAPEVVQRRAHERAQRFVGRTLDVLVEGPSRTDPSRVRGRSRHNKAVNFAGLARPGEIVPVEIHAATSQTLAGEESLLSRATA